jgi:hypothetical protein
MMTVMQRYSESVVRARPSRPRSVSATEKNRLSHKGGADACKANPFDSLSNEVHSAWHDECFCAIAGLT